MLIVIGALKIELDNIIRCVDNRKRMHKNSMTFYTGDIGGRDITIAVTGMGRDNAVRAVDTLFQQKIVEKNKDPDILITGFCGAAERSLKVGDLVTCTELLDLSGAGKDDKDKAERKTPGFLIPRGKFIADKNKKVSAVSCATTDHVVANPEEKMDIKQTYGADVIDMETFWITGRLKENGIPEKNISCVRAVSDDVRGKLPDYFSAETIPMTILGFLKSLFISIYSREEFRANTNSLRNVMIARKKINKDILEIAFWAPDKF